MELPLHGAGRRKGSTSFLKKRSKKLFYAVASPPEKQKFFGSFFQKRTFFLRLPI
jgi:hypothetical protein